jgi:hypothetical protein
LAAVPLVRIMALASLALFPAFMTEPVLVANSRVRDTLTMSLISLPPSVQLFLVPPFSDLSGSRRRNLSTLLYGLWVYVAFIFIRRRTHLSWGEIVLAVRSSLLVALCCVTAPAAVAILAGPSDNLSFLSTTIAGIGGVGNWSVHNPTPRTERIVEWCKIRWFAFPEACLDSNESGDIEWLQ